MQQCGPDLDAPRATAACHNHRRLRSPFLAAVPALVALVASSLRWWLQGSGNLYTATSRRAYVADPDLGWRVVTGGPPWLGLEVLAIVLAVAAAIAAGAWLVQRLERGGSRRTVLRGVLWTAGVVPLAVPLWAFAGGFGPAGARDALPSRIADAPTGDAITGALDAPAGRWEVAAHHGSAITARVSAGGEAFDARFEAGISGHWTGDPGNLGAPMTAAVIVPTASVDTGVGMRTASARDDYLQASRHPILSFRLGQLVAAAPRADGGVGFRADGVIGLVGREHPVEVTGALRVLDAEARARLGLEAGTPAMHAEAELRVRIPDTALASDAGDFDGDEIPVQVSLVLVHQAREDPR
jgi:hypothetical protein